MKSRPHDTACTPANLAANLGLDGEGAEVMLAWLDMAPVVGRITAERRSWWHPAHKHRGAGVVRTGVDRLAR